ncbi:MAG: hypothetical protein GY838_19245 [bacterium]|nr:hypothetical protein [bacterium]
MMAKRITLLALLAALLLVSGCIFSPEKNKDDEIVDPDGPPFAGSPEQLMRNFMDVYEDRDYTGYLTVIDPEFKIFLKQETVDEFGLPRDYFGYDEEIVITEKMFSGNPPREGVGAISNIELSVLSQVGTWELTENTVFPGALESQYEVQFKIMQSTTDGERQLNITGRIIFFLSTEQVDHNGRERTLYRMVGQIDETNAG